MQPDVTQLRGVVLVIKTLCSENLMLKQFLGFVFGLNLLLSPVIVNGEGEIKLRVQFEEGDVQKLTMTQKQSMSMDIPNQPQMKTEMENVMDMVTTCVGVDGPGVWSLQQTIARTRMTMEMPAPLNRTIKYDSQEEAPTDPILAQIDKMMRPMVGAEMTMKCNELGNITDFTMDAAALSGIKDSPAAAFGGEMFSEAGMKQMTEQSALSMPEGELKVGDTWMTSTEVNSPLGKMTVTRDHKYLGPVAKSGEAEKSGQVKIGVTAKISLEPDPNSKLPFTAKLTSGDGSGEIIFDNDLGRMISSNIKTKMKMELTVGNQVIQQDIRGEVIVQDTTANQQSKN